MATETFEIENKEIGKKEFQKSCCNCNCSCNTRQQSKEYIKRAQQNYRLRKIETDPNYKENERIRKKEYIEKNREQYNESRRLYMREYRARKKNEQAKTNIIQITDGLDAINIANNKSK